MTTTQDALERLKKGHESFIAGSAMPVTTQLRVQELAEHGQHPFATVITCSDSRVSPEILFNCRLGELFVIRTAGNVLSDIEMGSVEYAVEHLHTPIVLVLGHTHCGAVQSACEADEHGHCPPCLQTLLNKIIPSVEAARKVHTNSRAVADMAEDLNVENTMREIILNPSLKGSESIIYGVKYDIQTSQILYLNRGQLDADGNVTMMCLEW